MAHVRSLMDSPSFNSLSSLSAPQPTSTSLPSRSDPTSRSSSQTRVLHNFSFQTDASHLSPRKRRPSSPENTHSLSSKRSPRKKHSSKLTDKPSHHAHFSFTRSNDDPPVAIHVSPSSPPTITVLEKVNRPKKDSTADSCIRRLCASHQSDIGLLGGLWSSPSYSVPPSFNPSPESEPQLLDTPALTPVSSTRASPRYWPSEPVELSPKNWPSEPVLHSTDTERQRLLQIEMQLMRMQLQQAEVYLSPSNSSVGKPVSRGQTLSTHNGSTSQLRSMQPKLQDLLCSEADFRNGTRGTSTPTSSTQAAREHSVRDSVQSISTTFGGLESPSCRTRDTALCQGYVKMPRGLFGKFWCPKTRYCMLDSSRCFFYWKSKEQREAGRAKCISGVTRGTLLQQDNKTIEMAYAGGASVCVLKFDTQEEAKRWMVAFSLLDSFNSRRGQEEASTLGRESQRSISVSVSQSSLNPELRRSAGHADASARREVIQNAFLSEFRKEQQFQQLLRSSKTSVCAVDVPANSPLVLRGNHVY